MIIRQLLGLLAGVCCATAFANISDDKQRMDIAFPIPNRYELVNDYMGYFFLSKSIEITKKLQALEKRNGTQIVFLSVPSVGNESVDAYGMKVFEKWDLGNNGEANGVLILAVGGKPLSIFRGSGIQGALPDVKMGRIAREVMEPHFQREEFSEGMEAAIDVMIKSTQEEDTSPTFYDYMNPIVPVRWENILICVLVLFGLGYAVVLFWYRHNKRKRIS